MLWVLIRIASGEAILMSTHNIGFYEDLTKIIFELSSNIIKYAPYFFCWPRSLKFGTKSNTNHHLIGFRVFHCLSSFELPPEKTNVLVSDLVRHKPGCTATEDG